MFKRRGYWLVLAAIAGLFLCIICFGNSRASAIPTVGQVNQADQSVVARPLCDPAWGIVSSPSPGSADNFFRAVSASSANDVWAVGYYDDGTTTSELLQHGSSISGPYLTLGWRQLDLGSKC